MGLRMLLAMLAMILVGPASIAAAQTRSDYQIRGALFATPMAGGIEAASHKAKETQRRTVHSGQGPEAALLAGAGIISPMSHPNVPLCDDDKVREPSFDCQILFKKRLKSR